MYYSFLFVVLMFFFFKQKTAYEMRISDWSSDVCSSDLQHFITDELGDAVIDLAGGIHLLIEHALDQCALAGYLGERLAQVGNARMAERPARVIGLECLCGSLAAQLRFQLVHHGGGTRVHRAIAAAGHPIPGVDRKSKRLNASP